MSWIDIAAAVKGAFGLRPPPGPLEAPPPVAPEALPDKPAVSAQERTVSSAATPPVSVGLRPEDVATALYRGIFEREPDPAGFEHAVGLLQAGRPVEELIRGFLRSAEFGKHVSELVTPQIDLPDLMEAMPAHYERHIVRGAQMPVYLARSDAEIELMESLIRQHRYYDRLGVWSPIIDIDKEIIAATVRGLGARSCFELGCFTGPVLSLLADAGVEVLGSDVSHIAFVYAYPNVRSAMVFGDLLSIDLGRRFEVVLCMDVLEHISPLRLPAYIERLVSLVEDDGYLYLNSPMWGADRIFGLFESQYIEEWQQVADASYWRHWPCDQQGWPVHGHLVWASPTWWERTFKSHGLVRDETIERAIHAHLAGFFANTTGRRCLFVLRRPTSRKSSSEVAAAVSGALAELPGLPQAPPA